ncbi:MAG TPA: YidB family protein [Gaiellaceae bacterium]|jgi:uncharacterized protein YidB (DUF937 family)
MSEIEKALSGVLGGQSGGLGGILTGVTGGGGGGMVGMLMPVVGGLLAGGGLQKIMSGLEHQGAGPQASSWVSKGENQPVSGTQMKDALGADQLAKVAEKLGLSHDQAAEILAKVIPHVVDKASPDGVMPSQEAVDSTVGALAQGTPSAASA